MNSMRRRFFCDSVLIPRLLYYSYIEFLVTVLSQEAKEYFENQKTRDYEYLKTECGVESLYEYFDVLNVINSSQESKILDYLSEQDISLDTIYQPTPLNDQSVMYASLNPTIQSISTERFESGSWAARNEDSGDLEKLAFHTAQALNDYLSKGGPKEIISQMRENLDLLSNTAEEEHEEYVRVETEEDLSNGYYSEVYHTRFFKLPSDDGNLFDDFEKSYCRKSFANEIETANPDLLISGCKDVWRSVQDYLVQDPEENIVPHRDSSVTSKYGNNIEDSAVPGIFEIPERNMWVINIFHEGRYGFVDEEELRLNLQYANERINSE